MIVCLGCGGLESTVTGRTPDELEPRYPPGSVRSRVLGSVREDTDSRSGGSAELPLERSPPEITSSGR